MGNNSFLTSLCFCGRVPAAEIQKARWDFSRVVKDCCIFCGKTSRRGRFHHVLEPPNEASAKAGFGGAVLHLLLGNHHRSRVKAVLDGSRSEPRGLERDPSEFYEGGLEKGGFGRSRFF